MNTQLVIAAPIANAVVPKPTKAEIIEALATRKHAQLTKEHEEQQRKAELLEAEAKAALLTHVAANIHSLNFSVNTGSLYRKNWNDKTGPRILQNVSCRAELDNLPREVSAKCRAAIIAQEEIIRVPDILSIRRDIRDQLTGRLTNRSDRVAAILGNEKSSKALDQMLKTLEKEEKAPTVVPEVVSV